MAIPAVIAHHARRTVLRYKADHPWTSLLLDGLGHLQALTGSVDTRLLPPVHHAPEGRTLWPPERPDHRETTRGKPSHPTGIIPATTPATTPPKPTQPTNERPRLMGCGCGWPVLYASVTGMSVSRVLRGGAGLLLPP